MKKIIHKQALIKAYVKKPPRTEQDLNNWLEFLVRKINMKVVIPPRSYYVSAEGNRGITGQVGIETSHAALHCWDEQSPARIELDVYSCADFNASTIIEHLDYAFHLIGYEVMIIDRDDSFKVLFHCKSEGLIK